MKLRPIIFALLTTALLAQPALAWNKGACKADADKLCKDVPMAGGKLKKCLKEHEPQLTDACKANLLDAAVMVKENKDKNAASGGY